MTLNEYLSGVELWATEGGDRKEVAEALRTATEQAMLAKALQTLVSPETLAAARALVEQTVAAE